MGQSVTLTGRSISKHMNGRVNYEFTGVEDYKGDAVIYADTDSYFSGTIHKTNMGDLTAEELFEYCSIKWKNGKKEYSVDDKVKVLSYEPKTETAQYMPINYVYRHKVSKARWKVTDSLGNEIIVTGDHSIMVERNGNLIEVKPRDILPDDFLISVTNDK
jgi:intein/homing endonuclease